MPDFDVGFEVSFVLGLVRAKRAGKSWRFSALIPLMLAERGRMAVLFAALSAGEQI